MSKRKSSRPYGSSRKQKPEGTSLVVILSITSMAMIGYLVGETALALRPHPAHWGVGLFGGFIGWVIGRTYNQFKGDII